jgi:ATP-dependent Lon protease
VSTDNGGDDANDLDLPAIEGDVVSTGAAADSSDLDERLETLPRILRYAVLASESAANIEPRLIAEIDELCPALPENVAWAAASTIENGLVLADELDHRAVVQDKPALRSLADCVRMISLPLPRDVVHFDNYCRVGKALLQAFQKGERECDPQLCCDLEQFVFGWAALPICSGSVWKKTRAVVNASIVGRTMAEYRIAGAKTAAYRKAKEEERKRKEDDPSANEVASKVSQPTSEHVPDHRVVVARLSDDEMKHIKLKDVIAPLKSAINTLLPLVKAPPLHDVRNKLIFEFPYATDVIDFALTDLVGRTTVHLRPILIVGDAGGGKSRFARRLGEELGVNVWRTDASRSDGAAFAGTDRRWYSAEACHPFLAIAQGKIANPMVLVDEIEKAATRSDYGRLWDCLLGFLESETALHYPDPALQTNLDLSHISYIATANQLDPLPSPIRDRFRVATFPKPTADHTDALLPAVLADLARERGLDQRWVPPLDSMERTAVTQHWRGGSVRRLRRVVEAILRERDIRASRN